MNDMQTESMSAFESLVFNDSDGGTVGSVDSTATVKHNVNWVGLQEVLPKNCYGN